MTDLAIITTTDDISIKKSRSLNSVLSSRQRVDKWAGNFIRRILHV